MGKKSDNPVLPILVLSGIIGGIANCFQRLSAISGSNAASAALSTYMTIAWAVYGTLLLWFIYTGSEKFLYRSTKRTAGNLIYLAGFAWFVLALWIAGRASAFFFSLFRFLRRLDGFTVYHEIILSVLLLSVVLIGVTVIKKFVRSRSDSPGALFFGGAVLFVVVEWFCWFNLPLSIRKIPLFEFVSNLAAMTAMIALLSVGGRILNMKRSIRLERVIYRIQTSIRPATVKVILLLFLPGLALNTWAITGYSLQEKNKPGKEDYSRDSGLQSRPNILILLADALRADHLGVHGYRHDTTPFIDHIAGEGLVFERHYSETSWTKPSVASLFTGLHQSEHGVRREDDYLSDNLLTLAEEMQRAGYICGAFISNPYLTPLNGFGRGFSEYNTELLSSRHWISALAAGLPGTGWVWEYVRMIQSKYVKVRADLCNREFTNWLDTIEEPFFAYIHYMEPHSPYDPPEPYKQGEESIISLFRSGPAGLARIDRKLYEGEIRYWDKNVKTLFETLQERGLLERTIVVLTSDHGEEFYDHGGFNHHRTLYEEVIHIPLIMHGRDLLPAYGRISRTTHANDLGYTLLRLAGIDSADIRLPGRNMFDGESNASSHVIAELYKKDRNIWALIKGTEKFITTVGKDNSTRSEYYDLKADPQEKLSLPLSSPEALTLSYILRAHINSSLENKVNAEKVRLEAHLVEQLQNLGYLK